MTRSTVSRTAFPSPLETWEKGGKTPEFTASDVETVTFRTGFRGYDIAEVDDFLDQAWYTFAGYEG